MVEQVSHLPSAANACAKSRNVLYCGDPSGIRCILKGAQDRSGEILSHLPTQADQLAFKVKQMLTVLYNEIEAKCTSVNIQLALIKHICL